MLQTYVCTNTCAHEQMFRTKSFWSAWENLAQLATTSPNSNKQSQQNIAKTKSEWKTTILGQCRGQTQHVYICVGIQRGAKQAAHTKRTQTY